MWSWLLKWLFLVKEGCVGRVLGSDVRGVSGVSPSGVDSRDFYVSGSGSSGVVGSVDLRKFCSSVRDQGVIGSCASHAVIAAWEVLCRSAGVVVDASELFHYFVAREELGLEKKNVGMTLRHACSTLMKGGLSFEKFWPYDAGEFMVRPGWSAFWSAGLLQRLERFCVKQYFLVDSFSDLVFWLGEGSPVVCGLRMFPGFLNAWGVPGLGLKDLSEGDVARMNSFGGHGVLIVGYNKGTNEILIRNSWGGAWGVGGYAWVSKDLFELCVFEMRTITI